MRWLRVGTLLLLYLAPLFLIGLLLLLLWLSVSDLPTGAAFRSFVGLDNFTSALRSYNFRNAVKNSVVVAAGASFLAVACAWPVALHLRLAGRERSLLLIVMLLPAAMPVALVGITWRQLTAPLAAPMHTPAVALAVLVAAHAWRLAPFAVWVFLLLENVRHRVAIGLATFAISYLVIADAGVGLLVTGGEPFNATQLWASWIFQQGIGAGRLGNAAAMGVLLLFCLVVLLLTGSGLLHRADRFPGDRVKTQDASSSRILGKGGRLLLIPILLYMLVPYAGLLIRIGWPQRWPILFTQLLAGTDFPWWAANSLLLGGVTTAVAGVILALARPILAGLSRTTRRRAAIGLLVTVLPAWPTIYLSGFWLSERLAVLDRRLPLLIIYSAIVICVSVPLASMADDRSGGLFRLFALATLVGVQDFSLAFGFDGPSRTLDLSTGIVRGLGAGIGDSGALSAAAILITVGIILSAGFLLHATGRSLKL